MQEEQKIPALPVPVEEKKQEECLKEFEKGYCEAFKALDPTGREFMRSVVTKYISGDTGLLDALYSVDYEHRRVDPYTFFTSSDYLGHMKDTIYKPWWPHLLNICDPLNHNFEVILTGSLGYGKSYIGFGFIMAYYLHKVLCLRDPAQFFGLAKGSKIMFGIYNVDLAAAEDTGFFILRDQTLADSPFFNEVYRRSPHGTDEITFPKNIVVKTGSQVIHAAGKNVLAVGIDEMNLMRKGKATAKKAFEFANAVSRRLETRFMQAGGEMPGVVILIGSARGASDFIDTRIKAVKNLPGHYVVRGTFWDYNPRIKYCGKKFRVQVGSDVANSVLLDEVKQDGSSYEVREIADPVAGCDIIQVPVEHHASFEIDLEGSLQDLAGVSLHGYMKLFSNLDKLKQAENEELVNPFNKNIIGAYLDSGVELAVEFRLDVACNIKLGSYQPIRHPQAPRYIHVDLAKNGDKAGICMVHPSSHFVSTETVEGRSSSEGEIEVYDIKKAVEVDFCLGVCCGPKKEHIDFANIRRLIFSLRQHGYWIRVVTFDTWQSEDSIQRLTEAKIRAETLSVDKTVGPYMITRHGVYSNKIRIPKIPELFKELRDLEHDPATNKIDHPSVGSKDLSDALAGSVYKCLTDKISLSEFHKERGSTKFTSGAQDFSGYLGQLAELAQSEE